MNKNVVDDFGDDYFMNEYRYGAYIHNGLLYQLKGFNINGTSVSGNTRYGNGQTISRDAFHSLEHLETWMVDQQNRLKQLLENEPDKYYQMEDEDGDLVDSDDVRDEWDEWNDDVNSTKDVIAQCERVKSQWTNADGKQEDAVYLEFTPLSNPTEKQLLIEVKDFTSLKGFALKQGYINVKNKLYNISSRRCYKLNDSSVATLQENPEYAKQFIDPTYPTMREALEKLKASDNSDSVALSRKIALLKEVHYMMNSKFKVKWRLQAFDGEDIAVWVDGNKKVWARNKNIIGYINKKG